MSDLCLTPDPELLSSSSTSSSMLEVNNGNRMSMMTINVNANANVNTNTSITAITANNNSIYSSSTTTTTTTSVMSSLAPLSSLNDCRNSVACQTYNERLDTTPVISSLMNMSASLASSSPGFDWKILNENQRNNI